MKFVHISKIYLYYGNCMCIYISILYRNCLFSTTGRTIKTSSLWVCYKIINVIDLEAVHEIKQRHEMSTTVSLKSLGHGHRFSRASLSWMFTSDVNYSLINILTQKLPRSGISYHATNVLTIVLFGWDFCWYCMLWMSRQFMRWNSVTGWNSIARWNSVMGWNSVTIWNSIERWNIVTRRN